MGVGGPLALWTDHAMTHMRMLSNEDVRADPQVGGSAKGTSPRRELGGTATQPVKPTARCRKPGYGCSGEFQRGLNPGRGATTITLG